jgi:SAM-dependent methyltransferase
MALGAAPIAGQAARHTRTRHVRLDLGERAVISLRCPTCKQRVEEKSLSCPAGHRYTVDAGVLRLIEPGLEMRLRQLEDALRQDRQGNSKRIQDTSEFSKLPHARANTDTEWRLRDEDVRIIRRSLGSERRLSVLDLGAWNCWLSNQLATLGHDVIAADYFGDSFDGLGAIRHYGSEFSAIQIDLSDLSVLDRLFDVVVINHGLAFFADPIAHVRNALSKVRQNGLLVVLGL